MRSMMANPNASTSIASSESSEQKATHMADSNMNMLPPSLSHQSRSASDGPVAILWDIENCPVPSDVRPEDVGGNIRMALRVHPVIKGAVMMFSAYGDFNAFPRRLREGCQRTGVKLIDVPNGRKDAADKAILVDMFLFALDNPPPSSIMLISGDVDFAPALHILGQRGYTVILVIPSGVGVSSALCNAGKFVWDWPSVARGEGFVPPTKYLMPPRGAVADIAGSLMGCQINENPEGQNEEEAIVYRGFSQNYYNSRDLSIVSQSLTEYNSNSSMLPFYPTTLRSLSLPSGLNEVSGGVVSSGDQIESTLWVQPGDLNGLKGQLVKMLELSGGCLPLIRVPAEYQKFFGRPLYVAEYGAFKLVNLFKKMSDSLFVEGKGHKKFVYLRNWKAGPSAPPLILTRKDKKGKGTQEESMDIVTGGGSSDEFSDEERVVIEENDVSRSQGNTNQGTAACQEIDDHGLEQFKHELQEILVSYSCRIFLGCFEAIYEQRGSSRHQNLSYRMTAGDEVEDMFILLNEVKRQIPSVTAVSSGAIASDYQRLRVESVCSRLGLVSLAYMWKQDQSLLLQEMITNGIVAITVKVAALGLDPTKHLGKDIGFLKSYLHKLKEMYGINVCGEGGEYETLTLDCSLFVNARIVLDEFKVVLHSSDAIAPVGILHPLAFHLEKKAEHHSLSGIDEASEISKEKEGFVFEVQGDCIQSCEATFKAAAEVVEPDEVAENRVHIARTKSDNTFSICFWLQDLCRTSAGLQEDLEAVLRKIEQELLGYGFGWENVLYIHLYIADMNNFSIANETYVRYITQEKCPFGVPSRSTIELPLLQVGLGSAYIEVLVANDQSKRVLHVQSISCWAPSCIGPYSQATLHKEILYMAGQLGLDPPNMNLCKGGATAEMEQALENSEAIAKSFNCSISTSAVLFVIYCSTYVPSSERDKIQDKQDSYLKQMRLLQLDKGSVIQVLDPIFLYVLVPDLPKRALVEVKPLLYVPEDMNVTIGTEQKHSCSRMPSYWGIQHAHWHDSCIQKFVVQGKICAVVLCITSELLVKICSKSLGGDQDNGDYQNSLREAQMERVSRFCIYLLDKLYMQNNFSWEDTKNLRFYFPTSLGLPLEALSLMFTNAFNELAKLGQRIIIGEEPIFNLIPVLGAGRSATSMDDMITCELFARKS